MITVRRANPEDWEAVARFLTREGDATQRSRYGNDDPLPAVEIATTVETGCTFVAEAHDDRIREDAVVGIVTWRTTNRPGMAEAAMLVSTGWGAQDVGRRLVDTLISDASKHGIHTLLVPVIPRNGALRAALREAGLDERRTLRGWRDVATIALLGDRAVSVA